MQSPPRTSVSVRAISDPKEFIAIASDWNLIVRESGSNPFLLTELILEFMRLRTREGWSPLLLVLSAEGSLVGVAPLMTRMRFGLRFTSFLPAHWFSPDFVLRDQYGTQCIQQIVEFIFQKLKTDLLELTLPAESPNFRPLKLECETGTLYYETQKRSSEGHRLLRLYPGWDAFLSSQRLEFRSAGGQLVYLNIFVVNESIRALCDQGEVREMDFLTDLPFHKKWPSTLGMRVGVTVSRSYLPRFFHQMLRAIGNAYGTLLSILTSFVWPRPLARSSKTD